MKTLLFTVTGITLLCGFILLQQSKKVSQQQQKVTRLTHELAQAEHHFIYPKSSEKKSEIDQQKLHSAHQRFTAFSKKIESFEKNPAARFRALSKFLQTLEGFTDAELIQFVKNLAPEKSTSSQGLIMRALLGIAIETDPYAILELFFPPQNEHYSLYQSAFTTLIEKDINKAKLWLEDTIPDLDPNMLKEFQGIFAGQLLLTEPVAGLTHLQHNKLNPSDIIRQNSFQRHFKQLPDGGVNLMHSLHTLNNPSTREALSQTFLEWSLEKHQFTYFESLLDATFPDESDSRNIISLIGHSQTLSYVSLNKDADQIVDLATRRAPQYRDQIIAKMITQWAERDFNAAGEWLQTFPPSKAKDLAITGYVHQILKIDAKAAMEWADSIMDPKMKENTKEALPKTQ